MDTYTPKYIFPGHIVGRQFAGHMMVAVPEKKLVSGHCFVSHKNEAMMVNKNEAVEKLEFEDKFKRNMKYWLYYFFWKPQESQLSML